jgi:hypothetical protein
MPHIKGTDVSSLRTLLHEKGPDAEQRFLESLPPPLRQLYVETTPLTWNPVEAQAELYERAAAFLYPGRPGAIVEMHRALARTSYSSVYRAFVRIPTVEFIAGRAAAVWHKYYDTGDASIENATKTSLDFVLRQFPGLPRALREATTGHLLTMLEMTRARDPQVASPADTPQAWVWHVTWTSSR